MRGASALAAAIALSAMVHAQNLSDPEFDVSVADPAFATGAGPVVLIDGGHRNFHTAEGRYKPFADVLRSDGYRVGVHAGAFTPDSLADVDVVVIASAVMEGLDPYDFDSWPATTRSAFSDREIATLVDWVRGGGALLLVMDYQPVAGMSADLAANFGVYVSEGYAYDGDGENQLSFTRAAGTLLDHAVTKGRGEAERIERFETFAGTAVLMPYGAEPLLLFPEAAYSVEPEILLRPDTSPPADAPRRSIGGWSQGGVMTFGEGRFAVFGEAAAFSAQRYPNGAVTGMNDPAAGQNKQMLLNLMRWLSGAL